MRLRREARSMRTTPGIGVVSKRWPTSADQSFKCPDVGASKGRCLSARLRGHPSRSSEWYFTLRVSARMTSVVPETREYSSVQ